MNINEGLKEVSILKGKMSDLISQIDRQHVIKEQLSSTSGSIYAPVKQPAPVDPLVKELLVLFQKIETLKQKITEANVKSGALTIIHELSALKSSITTLRPLTDVEEETIDVPSYTQNPTVTKRTVNYDIADIRKTLKGLELSLQEKISILDKINYTTEL